MRPFLISVVLLGLVAGCASAPIGPHRIDVQQGNALDQENLSRLKPGLSRSQVRFLLGTPLVVDPFRSDRWDYVYTYAKAGKLTEQRRISLFFEGDTLARIEGDVPAAGAQEVTGTPAAATASVPAPAAVAPMAADPRPAVPAPDATAARAAAPQTSVVAPLSAPKETPADVDRSRAGGISLQPATRVEAIQPEVVPAFPVAQPATTAVEAPVLGALDAWSGAWKQRDAERYFAAYDAGFVPADGTRRADWEKRRRTLFKLARSIDVRVEAPTVERQEEGTATVTFNQYYTSDTYRDAVVKQLLMVERDGRWKILEERVLKTLAGAKQ